MCTFFKKQHNPAFMSHSPNFSLIFSHNLRCWGYLNILWGFHKHRQVVGEKNGCRSKILAPEVCSYMTLVNYLATFTVNFLKCKVGKLILPMVVVKINTAFHLISGTEWMVRFFVFWFLFSWRC